MTRKIAFAICSTEVSSTFDWNRRSFNFLSRPKLSLGYKAYVKYRYGVWPRPKSHATAADVALDEIFLFMFSSLLFFQPHIGETMLPRGQFSCKCIFFFDTEYCGNDTWEISSDPINLSKYFSFLNYIQPAWFTSLCAQNNLPLTCLGQLVHFFPDTHWLKSIGPTYAK